MNARLFPYNNNKLFLICEYSINLPLLLLKGRNLVVCGWQPRYKLTHKNLLRMWRNWYPDVSGQTWDLVPKGVGVRVPSSALNPRCS